MSSRLSARHTFRPILEALEQREVPTSGGWAIVADPEGDVFHDVNGNGTIDRWDFYDDSGQVTRVGLARADDGVMDAVAIYGAGQTLRRLEVSTRRDGRFDRVEFYEAERLTRAEEDTDGNGVVSAACGSCGTFVWSKMLGGRSPI